MTAHQQLVADIRSGLAAAADPSRAPQMQAYMKSALPFHGVPAPAVAKVTKAAIAAHPLPDRQSWQDTVAQLWDAATHREERYAALTVAGHRRYAEHLDPQLLPFLGHLVVTEAWWDYVDNVASHLVATVLRRDPAATVPVIASWAEHEDMWLRRTAILCQLGAKAATDTALLAKVIEANLAGSRHGTEFFIRKGIGWALREYAKTDADWVRAFVAAHGDQLSPLSRREALKNVSAK